MIRHQLSVTHKLTHKVIIKRWQWFRQQLMELYNMQNLPESFNNKEGEISENKAVEEDDLRYDMTPIEFNYNWHCQKLTFRDELHKVSITINNDDLYSYYWFKYESAAPELTVKFFVSAKEQYIELSNPALYTAKWIKACDELN